MGPYLSFKRFREELDVVFGTPTANGNNNATECRVSTEANERFVLHIRGIDTPTLSPECYQGVSGNADTVGSLTQQGLSYIRPRPLATCRNDASRAPAERIEGGLKGLLTLW